MDILFYGEKEKQFYFMPYAQSKDLDCKCNSIVTFNMDTAAGEIIAASPDELIIDADCIVDDGDCAAKIADISAPIMIIQGRNDPRVPVTEAEQAVAALRALGRTVEYLCYDDEGHGIAKLKNKLDCYPKMAAFLKKYLF